MRTRRITFVAIAVVTIFAFAAPAGAARPIPHPTDPSTVILRVESSPNGWGAEYPDGSNVTLYADRVEIDPVGDDGPDVFEVDEASVQRALRAARKAGLLRSKARDYGEAGVTDQGTTEVEVHAGAVDHTFSVYALLLEEGDRGLTAQQQRARRALRSFIDKVTHASFYGVP
jgi:hypothetical protein